MDKYYCKRPPYLLERGKVFTEKQKLLQQRLLAVLVFFLFVWAFMSFIRSDFFELQEIEVRGNVHTAQEEIMLALGAGKGENIWKISPSLLRERTETIARIEKVVVQRRLPRALLVEVVEKKVMALAPYGEYMLEVSFDGRIIGSTQNLNDYGLPLLTGVVPHDVTLGSYFLQGEQLSDLSAAIIALDSYGLTVSELNFADPANLTLITMDGLVAWLGDGDFSEKADLLSQISSQLPPQAEQGYLDLRVKEAPVFSPVANHVN